ncbi:diaminopimelate epimerase [Litoribacter ruber]|uniref:Diaminopimelate epimerase n=1 Tax=Litoribacter ruber TaxID=702568 RepID=A0AAP2G155_9BACT|nr:MULTISPECIES: diaminopimelate epimerase [Litoribacter]MBS9523567.1 diaminopimelate epimerase [Litoribacter alkaliphilus]MBT0812016.1 diaminopimelate epimerase [Litoribacter ruber]
MNLEFYKYQGTGNDFVMVDDRQNAFGLQNLPLINSICDRKFGVGADGLILIRNHPEYDFEMVYFNSDGTQSMCGNGARCAVAFSHFLGIISEETHFLAIDGPHKAVYKDDIVHLEMNDVPGIAKDGEEYFLNTGSPHHVKFVADVAHYPVVEEGANIRYSSKYSPRGTNVNFVEVLDDQDLNVRTYERGVENETLSCGTGVTACALVHGSLSGQNHIRIKTLGGALEVKFKKEDEDRFTEVVLSGPARQVFQGSIAID